MRLFSSWEHDSVRVYACANVRPCVRVCESVAGVHISTPSCLSLISPSPVALGWVQGPVYLLAECQENRHDICLASRRGKLCHALVAAAAATVTLASTYNDRCKQVQ